LTARIFALVLLAAVAAAARDVESLAAQLKDPKRRVAAYRELRAARDPAAVAPVRRAIEDLPDSQRHWGLNVLDAYPPDVARRAFRPLLRSSSPWTRLYAAEALHRRGVPNMARTIHAALRTPNLHERVKRRMLGRLMWGRLPRERALLETVRGFLVPGEPAGVIADAALVLKGVDDDGAVEPAKELLDDRRSAVRAWAAALLVHLGLAEHTPTVAEAMRTGELGGALYRVRQLLRGLGGTPREIRGALRDLLARDLPAGALLAVVRWVRDIKDRGAMPQLEKLLEHENAQVRKEAGEVLLSFAGRGSAGSSGVPKSLEPGDVAALARMMRDKDRDGVRAWLTDQKIARRLVAADALRRMEEESGLPVILAALADEDGPERATAARLLAGFRRPYVVPPLLAALEDESIAVRSAAFRSLGEVLAALFPQRRIRMGSTAYDPRLDPVKNAPAVARLRAWWREHRDKDW